MTSAYYTNLSRLQIFLSFEPRAQQKTIKIVSNEKVWNGKFTCEIKIENAHNDGWRLSQTS